MIEYIVLTPEKVSDVILNIKLLKQNKPLEVVSRGSETQLQWIIFFQLQVRENYSFLCHLRPNICKYRCLNTHFST